MKILYASAYPDSEFEKKFSTGILLSQAAQKFNKLYIKGFCLNELDVDVVLFDNNIDNQTIKEEYNGKTITYYIHQLTGDYLERKKSKAKHISDVVESYKKSDNCGIVVIDSLFPAAYELSKKAKSRGFKVVSIVTDLIDDTFNKKSLMSVVKGKILSYNFYRQFKFSDYLVLLSGAMIERIPNKSAKYGVFNGICDYELLNNTEQIEKFDKKILVYTGEIRKMYGIHNLVEAFISLDRSDAELWLYGTGLQFYPELQKIIEENPCVKYQGIKPNKEIVEIQKKATLLINPRLTQNFGEYIKYSFPSKNIEYMVSGTPCITTRLPAITKDYDDYLFYFDDESMAGMKKVLNDCLNLPEDELKSRGLSAKKFILNKLNNKEVAGKILDVFDN